MSGPLAGVRALEVASLGPVPFCAMMLSDMGADVLRIDRHEASALGEAAERDIFLRGRPSYAIDLKSDAGAERFLNLAARADIVIEGFRPGVAERLGVGPEACFRANPKLVYARSTGWGQNGPMANVVGHDINYLALTGLLDAVGPDGGKPTPPLDVIGDYGGGMTLAFGVVAALRQAERSGSGQVIDGAMIDTAALFMNEVLTFKSLNAWRGGRGRDIINGGAPYYNTYQTLDGGYLAVGCLEPKFYRTFLALLDLPPEEFEPQEDRTKWPARIKRLECLFRQRPRAAWETLFDGHEVCVTPVLTIDEAAEHPHMRARNVFVEIDGVLQATPAPRFSRTPGCVGRLLSRAERSRRLAAWGLADDHLAQSQSKIRPK